ncbi:MAG: hypothetical protein EOP84_24275, partial [Verrucomicrobiaceae bacterium]
MRISADIITEIWRLCQALVMALPAELHYSNVKTLGCLRSKSVAKPMSRFDLMAAPMVPNIDLIPLELSSARRVLTRKEITMFKLIAIGAVGFALYRYVVKSDQTAPADSAPRLAGGPLSSQARIQSTP